VANKGKPIPMSLRQQIREYRNKRISRRRIAALLNIHRNTVNKYFRMMAG
jgi:IS30 family transposase